MVGGVAASGVDLFARFTEGRLELAESVAAAGGRVGSVSLRSALGLSILCRRATESVMALL